MKKGVQILLLVCLLSINTTKSFAWGKTGHELVAEIAFHFLDDATKNVVLGYLKKYTIEEAATWMDENRGNSYYDFMKPWHYIDMDKGVEYHPSNDRNALTVLQSTILELRSYKTLKRKDVREHLFYLFHIIGDLHQPLHTGYSVDRGGNDIQINGAGVSGNLHSVWDTQIIDVEHINLDSCLATYNTFSTSDIADTKKVNVLAWMKQSRSYLDTVYNFKNGYLDQQYIDSNSIIIRKQLVIAGLRLANLLTDIFSPAKA